MSLCSLGYCKPDCYLWPIFVFRCLLKHPLWMPSCIPFLIYTVRLPSRRPFDSSFAFPVTPEVSVQGSVTRLPHRPWFCGWLPSVAIQTRLRACHQAKISRVCQHLIGGHLWSFCRRHDLLLFGDKRLQPGTDHET